MATRRRYSREFKLEAVRLVVQQGYTQNKAAEAVGVSHWVIRDWLRKFRISGDIPGIGKTGTGRPMTESDALKALRQENQQLRMENEILKKATAYFARESL